MPKIQKKKKNVQYVISFFNPKNKNVFINCF